MHAQLKEEAGRLIRWDRALRLLRDTILVVALIWCVLALVFSLTMNTILGILVLGGAYIGIAAVILFGALSFIIARMELHIARGVVRGRVEESIELLFQLMESDDDRSRRIAVNTLRQALPKVQSLSPTELAALHSALLGGGALDEPGLMTRMLAAVERCGNATSMDVVGRIAESESSNGRERRIRNAAKRCYAALELRLGGAVRADHHRPAPG